MKLSEVPNDPAASYINANYIQGWPNESHAFIATQGPLPNTIVDFYRMIWQEHVPVIVMMTQLFERNQVRTRYFCREKDKSIFFWQTKCERYFPESEVGQYGPFTVQVKSTIYRRDYEIRRLIVKVTREKTFVRH